MKETSTDKIFKTIQSILIKMVCDNGFDGEISPDTWLVKDLEFESIDIVILGTTIQKDYSEALPFAQFLLGIGQRGIRDIRVNEFVEFVAQHTTDPSDESRTESEI